MSTYFWKTQSKCKVGLTYQRGGSCTCPWRAQDAETSLLQKEWMRREQELAPCLYSIDWTSRAPPTPTHRPLLRGQLKFTYLIEKGTRRGPRKVRGTFGRWGRRDGESSGLLPTAYPGAEVTSLCPAHPDNGLSGSYSLGTQKQRQCGEQKKIKTNAPSEVRDHKNEVLLFKRNMRRV